MAIWKPLQAIFGGWKTHGPNAALTAGFATTDIVEPAVTFDAALRIGAVHSCLNLRSSVIGTLPLHLRNASKQPQRDNPLDRVLHDSPNSMQTPCEFWAMQVANVDMYGNSYSFVNRRTRDKSVISLEPFDSPSVSLERKSDGWYYTVGNDSFAAENVLHLSSPVKQGYMGIGRLEAGRRILASQVTANDYSEKMFRQGLKIGGFFTTKKDMTNEQNVEFMRRLEVFSHPSNAGRWMALLKDMEPVGGSKFNMTPSELNLIESQYFGIEEVCRLFNVPPQLIGHTDKASSWASSLEHINLFFLMYSVQPTIISFEQRIAKSLFTAQDRVDGLQAKFSVQGLLRSDMATQAQMFATALQNGYYSRDEVRDLLDRGTIEGGDKYTVQLNMASLDELGKQDNEQIDPTL